MQNSFNKFSKMVNTSRLKPGQGLASKSTVYLLTDQVYNRYKNDICLKRLGFPQRRFKRDKTAFMLHSHHLKHRR